MNLVGEGSQHTGRVQKTLKDIDLSCVRLHACNHSTLVSEPGGLQLQAQLGIHYEIISLNK